MTTKHPRAVYEIVELYQQGSITFQTANFRILCLGYNEYEADEILHPRKVVIVNGQVVRR